MWGVCSLAKPMIFAGFSEPNGMSTERPELDEHFDEGRFPGLRRPTMSTGGRAA